MQKPTGKEIGVFGVRTLGIYGEKILHAPKETEGRFTLIQCKDGTLVYQPVKP